MFTAPRRNLIGQRGSLGVPTPTSPAGLPGAGAGSWIDMTQEGGLDGIGQTILSDRAVGGRTFTQMITPGTYRTNQRNGQTVLRTSSILSGYVASSAPVIATSSPFCLWFVGQSNGADAIVWGNTDPNHQFRINYANPTRNLFVFAGPSATSDSLTVAESTAWNIIFFVRNSSNQMRFYLNGVPKHSVVSSAVIQSLNLGRFLESFNSRFVGDFGEAGYNAANLNTVQLNSLGMYLGEKWAIAWTPIV